MQTQQNINASMQLLEQAIQVKDKLLEFNKENDKPSTEGTVQDGESAPAQTSLPTKEEIEAATKKIEKLNHDFQIFLLHLPQSNEHGNGVVSTPFDDSEQLQEITVQQIKAENACHNQPSNIVLMEQMYENTLFKEEYEKLKETKEHNNTSHEVKSVLRSLLPNAEDLNTRNNPQQIYNKLHNEILLFK